jgi:hypothetical protein
MQHVLASLLLNFHGTISSLDLLIKEGTVKAFEMN